MNTIKEFGALGAQRVRRLALLLLLVGAVATFSLAGAQPAAADTAYPVNVTFDSVKFTMENDGCVYVLVYCDDDRTFELYGTVGAYTTAGAVSAGGLPYRVFGKWGAHPCETTWASNYGTTCTKEVGVGTWDFTKVFLCAGSAYQSCSTAYGKLNNTIPLQVHAGEQFKVTVAMQDYDALSANDTTCVTYQWFGPYTAAQLQAKTYVTDAQTKTLMMPFNGNGECWVTYHLS